MSAFTFVSCGNDDDNFGGLVGKWYFESNGGFKVVEFDYYNDCKGDIHDVTYSVGGNNLTIKHSNGKIRTVTFKVKGNELFVTDRKSKLVYKRL